jgi:2,4-didehydro-3-deoxy-L-rhamnonate hydrolase
MRLCLFEDNRVGLVQEDHVVDVTAVLDRLPIFRYPLPKLDTFIAELGSLRHHIEQVAHGQSGIPIAEVKLACPVANPEKIVAAPVNYSRHLKEAREDPEIHHGNQVAEIEVSVSFSKLLAL